MKKYILLSYPDSVNFSGQTRASEIIFDKLGNNNPHNITKLIFPAYKRGLNSINSKIIYIIDLFRYGLKLFFLLFKNFDLVILNTGQTKNKLFLHSLPILILFRHIKKYPIITSLHGNDFLKWSQNSSKLNLLFFLFKNSRLITTLGEKQENFLKNNSIYNFLRVFNTTEIRPLSPADIEQKHKQNPQKVLHLSLLIESKGFMEYIEALEIVARQSISSSNFTAILCGPTHSTSQCIKLVSNSEKEQWINNEINKLLIEGIELKWIKGAYGKDKQELFNDSTIFVFPSTFGTESSPIVLVEAAAAGCAIISSKIGEISSAFSTDDVFYIENTSPKVIAQAITYLLENKKYRIELAKNARKRFDDFFSKEAYLRNWNNIINNNSKY